MKADYILYSNKKTGKHVFIRLKGGKPSIVASDELALYDEGHISAMDCHHALVRLLFRTVDGSGSPRSESDDKKMEDLLRVPFDKMKDITG